MTRRDQSQSMHGPEVGSLALPGPLDLFAEPAGGSIISPASGYLVARNATFAESNDKLLRERYTGIDTARSALVHLADVTFEAEAKSFPEKRPPIMEAKFRLGFDTFMLGVILADPLYVEEYGARVPRNVNSLRALQRALMNHEDGSYFVIPTGSLESLFERSERELQIGPIREPRIAWKDYRVATQIPDYRGKHQRKLLKVDTGKTTLMLPGMKDICQRFIAVTTADTGGSLYKTHAVQGGSDAFEGMLLGGIVAKNVILEMALEELARIRFPQQDQKKAA
jgi:hypothetical protein